MIAQLFTIGYEGSDIRGFIETLKAAHIDVLLDIRAAPISRKKGFSKNALQAALQVAGIAYRLEHELGTPKTLRERVKLDRDYAGFFRDYGTFLAAKTPLLDELAANLEGNVALMCFERHPNTCHRLAVAAQLALLTGLTPRHLNPVAH
ncbi:MAG: DUF488 family protein [Burkholderiales bacterium]